MKANRKKGYARLQKFVVGTDVVVVLGKDSKKSVVLSKDESVLNVT